MLYKYKKCFHKKRVFQKTKYIIMALFKVKIMNQPSFCYNRISTILYFQIPLIFHQIRFNQPLHQCPSIRCTGKINQDYPESFPDSLNLMRQSRIDFI